MRAAPSEGSSERQWRESARSQLLLPSLSMMRNLVFFFILFNRVALFFECNLVEFLILDERGFAWIFGKRLIDGG